MPSQRIILGIGLAILLIIGAASIGLDLKSRSDNATVDRALGILPKLSDMRPLRAGRKRGAGLRTHRRSAIRQEYRESSDAILPALAALIEAVKDNPIEKQLIEETKALVERQIAVNGELIELRTAGDSAAVAALVSQDDRAATAAIAGNLAKAVAEERRLLFARRADRNQRDVPAGDRSRRRRADSDPRHRSDGVDPPLAPGTAGFAQRHPGHQRGAGGRGRRAHRASGRRP